MRPAAAERVALLDVLRGVAILGTLGTNVFIFTAVGGLLGYLEAVRPWWESPDAALAAAASFLTNGKFLSLLSIMFGVGLELQYRSARRRGLRWPGWYRWRAALLFLDGLLHYLLVVEFDILMGYAVTAVIAAGLMARGERAVRVAMWVAGAVHVVLLALLTAVAALAPGGGSFESTGTLFVDGPWWAQVVHRWDNLLPYRAEAIGALPLTVFLFLLGVRLARAGAFDPDERGRALRRRLGRIGLWVGVPPNLVATFWPGGALLVLGRWGVAPLMALLYLALVAWLVEAGRARRLQARLGEVKRMALSSYVLQNVIGSVFFYGWGLGLATRVTEANALWSVVAWVGIALALMAVAHAWLRRFDQGPLEAVWRRLYLLPQRPRGRAAGQPA